MTVAYVVAMDRNGGIGYLNKLPWHLPADLRFFRETTTGHAILMGRKTYESIGRPLPNRINIVLTRDPEYTAPPEVVVVHSPEEALQWFHKFNQRQPGGDGGVPAGGGSIVDCKDELMVIGGAEVFRLFQPYVDKLIVTWIDHSFDVDTYFPGLPLGAEWELICVKPGVRDEKNPYDYEFRVYQKRSQTLS